MTAFADKTFSVPCSSGTVSDEEMQRRWDATFGKKREGTHELVIYDEVSKYDPDEIQTVMKLWAKSIIESATVVRVAEFHDFRTKTFCDRCGVMYDSLRDGRVVKVTDGLCDYCAARCDGADMMPVEER